MSGRGRTGGAGAGSVSGDVISGVAQPIRGFANLQVTGLAGGGSYSYSLLLEGGAVDATAGGTVAAGVVEPIPIYAGAATQIVVTLTNATAEIY